MTSFRVILVNYRCLHDIATILRSGVIRDAEVVLVDNASDRDDVTRLAAEYDARHILMPRNVGFAAAVNAAMALAPPPSSILLLNPDVVLGPEQLTRLREALVVTDADAVGPVLVDGDGKTWVSSAGGPVTLRSVFWYFAGVSHLIPRLSGFFWTRRQIRGVGPRTPSWLCGACLLIKGEAIRRFGGFPTDEIVYGEDVGWGVDVVRRGGRLHLARDVVVVHAGGGSGGSDAWVDATARTLHRRMGPVRGTLAVAVMRAGLAARRAVRSVSR